MDTQDVDIVVVGAGRNRVPVAELASTNRICLVTDLGHQDYLV